MSPNKLSNCLKSKVTFPFYLTSRLTLPKSFTQQIRINSESSCLSAVRWTLLCSSPETMGVNFVITRHNESVSYRYRCLCSETRLGTMVNSALWTYQCMFNQNESWDQVPNNVVAVPTLAHTLKHYTSKYIYIDTT